MHTRVDPYRDDDAWLNGQAAPLREGRLGAIDAKLRAKAREAMGRRERKALVSRLIVLIAYGLKWHYQPAHRPSGWRGSLVEQRVQVNREIRLSPSLDAFLGEAIQEAYPDAVPIAA